MKLTLCLLRLNGVHDLDSLMFCSVLHGIVDLIALKLLPTGSKVQHKVFLSNFFSTYPVLFSKSSAPEVHQFIKHSMSNLRKHRFTHQSQSSHSCQAPKHPLHSAAQAVILTFLVVGDGTESLQHLLVYVPSQNSLVRWLT